MTLTDLEAYRQRAFRLSISCAIADSRAYWGMQYAEAVAEWERRQRNAPRCDRCGAPMASVEVVEVIDPDSKETLEFCGPCAGRLGVFEEEPA
jgi:hypothetical protein